MADTLMYFKKLEAAGFSRKQAEAQVEMIRDFGESQYPTRVEMNSRFDAVDARFAAVDARFDRLEVEIGRMSDRITIRLGTMLLVGFGALAALIKLT